MSSADRTVKDAIYALHGTYTEEPCPRNDPADQWGCIAPPASTVCNGERHIMLHPYPWTGAGRERDAKRETS
jgi:hypothetical protein